MKKCARCLTIAKCGAIIYGIANIKRAYIGLCSEINQIYSQKTLTEKVLRQKPFRERRFGATP